MKPTTEPAAKRQVTDTRPPIPTGVTASGHPEYEFDEQGGLGPVAVYADTDGDRNLVALNGTDPDGGINGLTWMTPTEAFELGIRLIAASRDATKGPKAA